MDPTELQKCTRCSARHASRHKRCSHCREKGRLYRKRRITSKLCTAPVKDGFKCCKRCLNVKPLGEFKSIIHRRTATTVFCQRCRQLKKKNYIREYTKQGRCRKYWTEWKRIQKCVDCNMTDSRCIEADHVKDSKVKRVSQYSFWASHGGIQAMKAELLKCEARCRFCHRIVTQKRNRENSTARPRPYVDKRRFLINSIKLKIGSCNVCKRPVSENTCCGFDFDHIDQSKKKMSISRSVYLAEDAFKKVIESEIPKTRLLCANCHHIRTSYQ